MYQRGDVSALQVVTFLLALTGFVILLTFVYYLYENNSTSQSVCELSVLTRASSPSKSLQALVPLKCETQKICLTRGFIGDSCTQFAGEKNVATIRLTGNAPELKQQLESLIADHMYYCWTMMKQGKLDLFGDFATEYGLDTSAPTCVVCDRIALSAGAAADLEVRKALEQLDVQEYMRTKQVAGGSKTYLQAFTDTTTSSFARAEDVHFAESGSVKGAPDEVPGVTDNQIAIVFSQIKTQNAADVLTSLGSAATGAAFLIPGKGRVLSALYLGPQAIVTVPLTTIAAGGAAYQVYLHVKEGQNVAAGYCGSFTSNQKSTEGCSLVQAVNYNVNSINALCPSIQGAL